MTLSYEIRFLDYWHMSSGLSAGAKLDSSVVKDSDGLPYVPGKTIKGLAREMAEEFGCDFVNKCFGGSSDEKNDKCYDEKKKNISGECYFSNATLKTSVKNQIVTYRLQNNLYDEIASTQIGSDGIAVDNSLREIEVVVPLSLHGEIADVPNNHKTSMSKSLKMIKRMGLNRNRGLGRCEIAVEVSK